MKGFLEDGNLEHGIHPYSIENFEEQFVKGFPYSTTRESIYENFMIWFNKLAALLPPCCVWLDGSFLTTKTNPNDIDLVVFYRPEQFGNDDDLGKRVNEFIHRNSHSYNCDAYLCLELDHLNPNVKQTFGQVSIMKTYWMGQFTFDRLRNAKGMVEFTEDVIRKHLGGEEENVATGTD